MLRIVTGKNESDSGVIKPTDTWYLDLALKRLRCNNCLMACATCYTFFWNQKIQKIKKGHDINPNFKRQNEDYRLNFDMKS